MSVHVNQVWTDRIHWLLLVLWTIAFRNVLEIIWWNIVVRLVFVLRCMHSRTNRCTCLFQKPHANWKMSRKFICTIFNAPKQNNHLRIQWIFVEIGTIKLDSCMYTEDDCRFEMRWKSIHKCKLCWREMSKLQQNHAPNQFQQKLVQDFSRNEKQFVALIARNQAM